MSRESGGTSVLWSRIESALRKRPPVAAASVDRVMARVRMQRLEPAPAARRSTRLRRWLMERRTITVSPVHLLAASVIIGIGLFALRGLRHSLDTLPIVPGTTASPAILAAARNSAPADERPVQFVFVARDARLVTIAGDFNDWNPTATPLKRAGTDGVWSIVLPLSPGRHLYSFVVDGRLWVPDAEAPRAPENEFGTESSVVLVERGT
jgi:hypothetical protein